MWKYPVSLKIFFALMIAVIFLGTQIIVGSSQEIKQQMLVDKKQFVKEKLIDLEAYFHRISLPNQKEIIQDQLAIIATDNQLNFAYLLNQNNKILLSALKNYSIENQNNLNIKLNQSNTKRYVEEVMQLLKPKVWVNRDTHKLYGVVPVMVLEDEYNIQTENNAIFFVEYDLQWINQQVYRNLFNSLRLNLLLLVLTALSLGYYFHVTISKRIRSIIKMAKSYQKWGYLQELAVDGHDEITDLAFSFMEMVRQIELQRSGPQNSDRKLGD